jgi:hypothetical protein
MGGVQRDGGGIDLGLLGVDDGRDLLVELMGYDSQQR